MAILRIAIIAPCWFEVPPKAYGGIEWMCAWLADGLVERGHEVFLVSAGASDTMAAHLQTFPEAPSDRLGDDMPEVVHAAAAYRMLKDLKVDVFHDNTLCGPLMGAGRRVPLVVTAHGPLAGELGDLYRNLGDAIQLVAISDAQREAAPDLPWAGRVYNAIPVDEYPFLAEKEGFVLFLGRLSPEKGAHIAIDVAREAGLPLVIAGKRIEPAEHAYWNEFVAPKLDDDIHWIGQAAAPRKKELLSKARCLIFPITWEEPFGLVMAEAMACGTPVVALRRGSVPELVDDEVTGFIYDDPSDLAKGIARANQIDPQACRDRAKKLFDIPANVLGYEAVYRKIAKA